MSMKQEDRCPGCGALRSLVGRMHKCRGRKAPTFREDLALATRFAEQVSKREAEDGSKERERVERFGRAGGAAAKVASSKRDRRRGAGSAGGESGDGGGGSVHARAGVDGGHDVAGSAGGGGAASAPGGSGRGRPKGQKTVAIPVRLKQSLVDRIDAWAEAFDKTRAEAIRALLEAGLGK